MEFSKRLRTLRIENGLLQKEVASSLEIANSTYNGYEKGAREPDLNMLIKISKFFDVSIDYLLGTSNSKKLSETDNQILVLIEDAKNIGLRVSDIKELIETIKKLQNK